MISRVSLYTAVQSCYSIINKVFGRLITWRRSRPASGRAGVFTSVTSAHGIKHLTDDVINNVSLLQTRTERDASDRRGAADRVLTVQQQQVCSDLTFKHSDNTWPTARGTATTVEYKTPPGRRGVSACCCSLTGGACLSHRDVPRWFAGTLIKKEHLHIQEWQLHRQWRT